MITFPLDGYLNIHVGLKSLFDPPAVIIDLLQVFLFIFVCPHHHFGNEILQETKTLVSVSDRVFRQEVVCELCIFNKYDEGGGASFQQETSFADSLSQCTQMVHLNQGKLGNNRYNKRPSIYLN